MLLLLGMIAMFVTVSWVRDEVRLLMMLMRMLMLLVLVLMLVEERRGSVRRLSHLSWGEVRREARHTHRMGVLGVLVRGLLLLVERCRCSGSRSGRRRYGRNTSISDYWIRLHHRVRVRHGV